MNALSKRRGCIEVQSLDKECTTREERRGIQGLDKYVNLEPSVTFFLLTVRITDYHWDRHLYFVIYSHHAQTMTHTPPSDDSILILLLVVLAACDSD
jgi:hypothetical protein